RRGVGGFAAEGGVGAAPSCASFSRLARLDVVLGARLDIVVGPDGARLDLLLRATHVLQGRAELDGETSMRHKNKANHGAPRRCFLVAPHERVPIITIRSPHARAFPAFWRPYCIAVKTAPAWPAGAPDPGSG